jgi:hypothetical protein
MNTALARPLWVEVEFLVVGENVTDDFLSMP